MEIKKLKDGEACRHPGCLNHVSHPCEGCGRISGKSIKGKIKYENVFRWEAPKVVKPYGYKK